MSETIENRDKCTPEKLFTQSELSRLINKRLSRERRNNAELSKLAKLLKELTDKKIINAHSYAEAAQELYSKLMLLCNDENMNIDDGAVGKTGEKAESAATAELVDMEIPEEDLQADEVCEEIADETSETRVNEEAETTEEKVYDGTGDEPDKVNLSESFADQAYGTDCEVCEKEEAYGLSEISEFLANFPDSRALKIITSHEFLDFCRRQDKMGLCELYDSFCKHFGALASLFDGEQRTESEHLKDGDFENINPRNIISEYSSTGFSGRSASPSSDDGANLSPLQRKIAKSAGISYREYASMLREIPQYSKSDKRTLTKIRI